MVISEHNKHEKELREFYEKNLKAQGVILPTGKQLVGLVCLYNSLGSPVNKDTVAKYVQAQFPLESVSGDQQLRHLRVKGWYVLGSGRGPATKNTLPTGQRMPESTYALISVVDPHPDFVREQRLTRQGRLGAYTWDEVKLYYKNRCAHCGKETDHLDKGHMDPTLPVCLSNIIPLCVECNNWAQSDIVFSADGRIQYVLNFERFTKP